MGFLFLNRLAARPDCSFVIENPQRANMYRMRGLRCTFGHCIEYSDSSSDCDFYGIFAQTISATSFLIVFIILSEYKQRPMPITISTCRETFQLNTDYSQPFRISFFIFVIPINVACTHTHTHTHTQFGSVRLINLKCKVSIQHCQSDKNHRMTLSFIFFHWKLIRRLRLPTEQTCVW